MEPQISYLALFILGLAGLLVVYAVFQVFSEARDRDHEEEEAVQGYLRRSDTSLDLINVGLVEEIWKMPATPPKMKGDALEHFTVRLYKGLDYNAWTVDELKRMGTSSPYDLTKLVGYDQGGDVIADKTWYEEITGNDGTKAQVKRTERVLIQCKAYAQFNDETSNSTIQATISARTYYESLLKTKFDKTILISTAEYMSAPAHDLAKHGKVEIILQQKLKDLVVMANYNIRMKTQELEKSTSVIG